MGWSIHYLENEQIIVTVYAGALSVDDIKQAATETLALGAKNNVKCYLGDCSTLEPHKSLFDVYAIARFLFGLNIKHQVREAIILPGKPLSAKQLKFYETLAFNRGFLVKVFNSREDAVAWLLEE